MSQYLQFGRYTKGCPRWLVEKVRPALAWGVTVQSIQDALKLIREEFDPNKHETVYTNDYRQSRFITVTDILKKRQRSCGSMATVVASVLRNLNYPTKLIHGFYVKDRPDMRHAWNEVYLDGKWLSFDITRKDFKLDAFHRKKEEFVDWEELETRS